MSRTVSVKPITTLTEQCSQCGLWFEFLHPGRRSGHVLGVYPVGLPRRWEQRSRERLRERSPGGFERTCQSGVEVEPSG
jgi:hypothetical protein